jgi:hypothetical protein
MNLSEKSVAAAYLLSMRHITFSIAYSVILHSYLTDNKRELCHNEFVDDFGY